MQSTRHFAFALAGVAACAVAAAVALADTPQSTRVVDPKQHLAKTTSGYPYREKADYVLKELDLKPGEVVVDIGAGDGWWSERMAKAVGPQGTVHAAEVEQKLVDKMKEQYASVPQLKSYLCKPDSTELPEGSCDLAFISQVYHHLPRDGHVDYLRQLRKVVRPTGRLCIIEKYSSIAQKAKDHGTQLSRVVQEAEESGWVPVRCELITGTEHFLAIFVQKGLFEPKTEPEAGAAAVDITPPPGLRLAGYYSERAATGAHDPLFAKVLVLRQGDQQAAIVVCDLIGMPREVTARARELIQQKTGIPAGHVLIAATHTHTGPLFSGAIRKQLHEESVAREGDDPHEKVDYAAMLVEKLVQAVADAKASLKPAKLQAGIGKQQGLSFNRRYHMKSGPVQFNPGRLNPNIVRPAGPIDPDVGLLLVRDAADARPRASLAVFAMHPDTVGGNEYGADYPGYLQQVLRQKLGDGFVSIFGNGACGDINHIDVSNNKSQKGHNEARRIGETLGATVLATLPQLKDVERSALAVRSRSIDVPLKQVTAEEIAWSDEALKKADELPFLDQVKAYNVRSLKGMSGKTVPLEVQVFRIADDVAMVGLPGEIFVELGLAIKRASPFATTLVVELSNDSAGYIPTKKAFGEGSYETINSRIQPGGGEMLVDAAVQLLRELKAE